jgi:hypothetical protein
VGRREWAAIDLVDALYLLSFEFKENSEVRSFAVERLSQTSDQVRIFKISIFFFWLFTI